ncbi:MAG: hypothetical protein R3308_03050, partial [Thiohalobacterales bacterium]|nr:hypothetical protein [Thiohalobacterales bacterium]
MPQGEESSVAAAVSDSGFSVRRVEAGSLTGLLQALRSAVSESEYDNLFYFFADCPLLDPELSGRMLENHRKYYADYTFADGYPYGLSPEILKPGV